MSVDKAIAKLQEQIFVLQQAIGALEEVRKAEDGTEPAPKKRGRKKKAGLPEPVQEKAPF